MPEARPVRIANCSGFFGDRLSALKEVVSGGPVDVVTGDYLAEVTMSILGKHRARDPEKGYVPTFALQLKPVFGVVLERGIKLVVNAGGLNPHGLTSALRQLGAAMSLEPKVATLTGDDLRERLPSLRASNGDFPHFESGESLPSGDDFVHTANAYLGAWGIVQALAAGADIVVCPRVTDASLVVGAAAWWHGWQRGEWNKLAGAVAAGHVIECGAQATGGNYSSFREVADLSRPGFPIAEVAEDGSSVITKHPGTAGEVSVGTVTAQLVYEVGGPRYLNPDVTTRLDSIELEQLDTDRVALRSVVGEPPPDTTKVAITCKGQFRNEMTFALVGLELDAKQALFEQTTRAAFKTKPLELVFQRLGAPLLAETFDTPLNQDQATQFLRVIATSDDENLVSRPFGAALIELALSSYPGLFAMDLPGAASEATGYWPTVVKQSDLDVRLTHSDGRVEEISLPPQMLSASELDQGVRFPSTATEPAVSVPRGNIVRAPLGHVADARSGDKGGDANVGLWTRTDEGYAWLCQELDVDRLRQLLPEAANLPIERYELPKLRAVNFVIRGLLQGGAVATLRFDRQAKALGEFLRARNVDVPEILVR
ncbi:MAG: acyclic terpene utilization AtuA family protein [Polyangiaceae bacterium]